VALFTDLLPHVVPECSGVPEPVAIHAIRNAARLFCDKSTAWRSELLLSSVTSQGANVGEYALTTPAGSMLVSVLPTLQVDGLDVCYKPLKTLNEESINWRTHIGRPYYFYLVSSAVIRLTPFPTTVGVNNIRVYLVLKPTLSGTTLDDYVFNDWGESIATIAKSQLMSMPNVEWFNPQLSAHYQALGDMAMTEALSKVVSGYMSGLSNRNNRVKGSYY
jgi:hypothetical protein